MSGITPLLDTLLHQVLGKRVDTAAPERQPAAVKPLVPAQAIQRLRSDSRLNPQTTVASGPEGKVSPAEGVSTPPPANGGPQIRTQLSEVARQLSDLMGRARDSSAPIRPAAPIVAAGDKAAVSVATNLRQSIELSGLFYEAHVARWSSGSRSRQLLDREPQMRLWQGAMAENTEAIESLQRITAQQLEMLAQQRVRWSGEIWPGFFAEFCIQPQVEQKHENTDGGAHQAPEQDAQVWQTDISLQLSALGKVDISVGKFTDRLSVIICAEDGHTAAVLSDAAPDLYRRLQGNIAQEVQLTVAEVE